MTRPEFVLTIDCPDAPGLIHAVAGFVLEKSGNILESEQFNDPDSGRFFQRVHFSTLDDAVTEAVLRAGFAPIAERYEMAWALWDATTAYRTLLLVSKEGHCLNDLLFRWSTGNLQIEIPAIVSNHLDLKPFADHYGIPFHHIPVTKETKAEAEAKLMSLVTELKIDLVVLARYMQILSDDLCRQLEGKAINIHHSFLPSFKGAKPYHQAWERGVKLVGATAHYVTADLDEGPIIEQDIMRVDHRASASAIVAAGKDVEAQVLSRAIRWHSQTRILLNGHKTVVFR
ncbi:formyltetrahydrofolate deformylase [Nocardioides sp.]|uniref:formyltetrahydrofolate deformylase n=1 Tax=Nocardioides sp. TaxID=35761 RepID=UPI00261CD7E6|nr:formyltetrahydrofolate deformylase [Nocardioides sp.]